MTPIPLSHRRFFPTKLHDLNRLLFAEFSEYDLKQDEKNQDLHTRNNRGQLELIIIPYRSQLLKLFLGVTLECFKRFYPPIRAFLLWELAVRHNYYPNQ